MSFIDFNTDDAQEMQTAPDGKEQLLTIVTSKQGVSKNSGKPYIQLMLTCEEISFFKDFSHFINLPFEGDEEKTRNAKLLQLKRFKDCAGISGGFEVPDENGNGFDQLAGMKFWAVLREEDKEEYGMQNSIKKLISPGK